jgi:hypothetical protein
MTEDGSDGKAKKGKKAMKLESFSNENFGDKLTKCANGQKVVV